MSYRITNLISQPLHVGEHVLAVNETREYDTLAEIGLTRAYLESPEAQQLLSFEEVVPDTGGGDGGGEEPTAPVGGYRGDFIEVSQDEGGYALDLSLGNSFWIHLINTGDVYLVNAGNDGNPAHFSWDLFFSKEGGTSWSINVANGTVTWEGDQAPPALTQGMLLHVKLHYVQNRMIASWSEYPPEPA